MSIDPSTSIDPDTHFTDHSTSAKQQLIALADSLHIQLSFTEGAFYKVPLCPSLDSLYRFDTVPSGQPSPGSEIDLSDEMGLAYNVYLNADRIFGCKSCKTHLATHDAIISRNFRGQHGKAYLFASVVNIQQAEATERNMTTGKHIVRDISCRQCKETVGWKYDKAFEASEKYKEGKYILEAELLSAVY
ncbi:hypothetical protein MMC26_003540 [Xylographa opegraphella]|nr:hypothetical protein [Xylographa opegraphella]